ESYGRRLSLASVSWRADGARLCRVSSASNLSLVEGEESQNPALNEGFHNLEPVKGTAFGGLLGTSGAFLSRSSNVELRPVPNSHRLVLHVRCSTKRLTQPQELLLYLTSGIPLKSS
ncbi:hypothetical protein U1Q18_026210, partial [Sarracenia purpurea var. burkii]